ncbi:Major sperm protein [Dirofilaria immitis]|nr:Major sperm protein [Dirofilaria immitis]
MSYLQCTPATIQVPCTGGTTTHILEAIGTERLAFKVKLKQKYYDLYRPGKPGRTKLTVEYIASPAGYDPRKPFVEGADVGVLNLHVRAYSDKRIPDKSANITGKLVTKTGQKFTPSPDYDDLKLEKEIEQMYKDKEKAVPIKRSISKDKLEKGKEKDGKEKDESTSSSEEDAPIQVIIPDIWKNLDIGGMQKNNDELKIMLQMITNENKPGTGPGSGQMLSTVHTAATTPITRKSDADITVGGDTKNVGTSTIVKNSTGSTSLATHAGGAIKFSSAGADGAIETPADSAIKTSVVSGTAAAKGPLDGAASAVTKSGAGEVVENYLSAMLAAGGPTVGTKVSDRAAAPADRGGGGVQEFTLYLPGGIDRGIHSMYMSHVPAANRVNTGHRYSSSGGGGSSSSSAGGYAGSGARGTSSVYL